MQRQVARGTAGHRRRAQRGDDAEDLRGPQTNRLREDLREESSHQDLPSEERPPNVHHRATAVRERGTQPDEHSASNHSGFLDRGLRNSLQVKNPAEFQREREVHHKQQVHLQRAGHRHRGNGLPQAGQEPTEVHLQRL